jgi:Tol biopolymer transport system component
MGPVARRNFRRLALFAIAALLWAAMVLALDAEKAPLDGDSEENEVMEVIEVVVPDEESAPEGAEPEVIKLIDLEKLEPSFVNAPAGEEPRADEAGMANTPESALVNAPGGEELKADEAGTEPARAKEEPKRPAGVKPLFVHPLTGVERGRNDSNPLWSPAGDRLAFERSVEDKKEIVIATAEGSILHKIYYQHSDEDDEFGFLLPASLEEVSYNAGMSWSPDGTRFVFMSNGGTGNYDLYLGGLGGHNTTRLTEDPEKDGHAHWSPVEDRLVFISGRTGKADVYLMDLAFGEVARLTRGEKAFLYPRWSPDGKRVAMIYGSNENHDVYIIDDVERSLKTLRPLTSWPHDDLRPVWSPDGKKVAFYSNYNEQNDPKAWSLVVVAADGSDPKDGGLASRVVATDVIPDIERGPAWMPDSRRIVYVKNDRYAYNPLYVVDIDTKAGAPLITGTRMNHDVVCSADGTIAFRAQVEQWDHMFVARVE